MAETKRHKVLLSLHGFHSSPASLKAQQMAEYVAKHHPDITFICPQLSAFPEQMWQQVSTIFEQYPQHQIGVVGSSLGGFLATQAVQSYAVKAVLVNPAVTPYVLLTQYQGLQKHPYLNQEYLIDADYMQQLKALNVETLAAPENIWVLQQKGDEVLDYRDALLKYQACKVTCEDGGDHSFVGFDRYLADIIEFLY